MNSSIFRLAFLLTSVAVACSATESGSVVYYLRHPQEKFCSADFVVRAIVLPENQRTEECKYNCVYELKILKIYKGRAKLYNTKDFRVSSVNTTNKEESTNFNREDRTKIENTTINGDNTTINNENTAIKGETTTFNGKNVTRSSENNTTNSVNNIINSENTTINDENTTFNGKNVTKIENNTNYSGKTTINEETTNFNGENIANSNNQETALFAKAYADFVKPLRSSTEYLVAGRISNGNIQLNLGSWIQPWSEVTLAQRAGIRGNYAQNCHCQITPFCGIPGCDQLLKGCDVSGYKDLREFYLQGCEWRHSYCLKNSEASACSWHETAAYKNCKNPGLPN